MSTTVTNRPDGDRRKHRKGIIGLAAMAVAGALVVGLGYAYFSDSIDFGGSATAGTLDLTGSYTVVHENAAGVDQKDVDADDNSVANFNPGDELVITVNLDNAGNKSAWVETSLEVTGALEDGNYLTTTVANAAMDGGTAILNGTGANAETETGGADSLQQVYTITFDADAGNAAQGEDVAVDVTAKALQYRNNANPDFSNVEADWQQGWTTTAD